MARQESTSGVHRAYAVLFAYIIATIEEMGSEKAFTLLSKVVEERGKEDGKALIRKLGIQETDLDAGLAVYSAFLTDGGISHQIEKTGQQTLIRIQKCPMYTAYYSSGLACDWLVEAMCKNVALPLVTSVLKQVNPKFKAKIRRFKTSSDDYCLEELVLE